MVARYNHTLLSCLEVVLMRSAVSGGRCSSHSRCGWITLVNLTDSFDDAAANTSSRFKVCGILLHGGIR